MQAQDMVEGQDMAARLAGQAVKAWLEAEDEAVQAVRLRAVAPRQASPEIIAAPARGPQMVAPQYETVQTASGPRVRRATQDGFHPVRAADAFDRMALQHRRAGGRGALFTVAQVEAGRAYAALAERVASEGVKCTSLDGARAGSGGARDWMDGVMLRSEQLARLRAAIGRGAALPPCEGEAGLTDRALVDAVCLAGRTISEVLRDAGRLPTRQDRADLMGCLGAALDRMHDVRA
jgi:hypothetical protein